MPMENNLTLKTYMAIMAERDAAIRERNMALDERKRLFAERDMAMLQRDAALAERNSAIEERDKALAALHLREDSINENNNNNNSLSHEESKHHLYHPQQMHDVPWLAEPAYHPTLDDAIHHMPDTTAKPKKGKQKKETASSSRKLPKPSSSSSSGKVVKRETEIQMSNNDWTNELNFGSDEDDEEDDGDDEERPALWRENSGLNQITFDETVMPVPVCGCSGVAHPCYKWGNGGWQSACCSSGYSFSGGKRQVGRAEGRKMSGSAFTQLLNQIASEGYDLSTPVDLTNYWEN